MAKVIQPVNASAMGSYPDGGTNTEGELSPLDPAFPFPLTCSGSTDATTALDDVDDGATITSGPGSELAACTSVSGADVAVTDACGCDAGSWDDVAVGALEGRGGL